jgi:RND family efflux transporter MFP subunit
MDKKNVFGLISVMASHRKMVILGIMGILVVVFAFDHSDESATQRVQTMMVKKEDIRVTVTGSGQVYAENAVDLKAVVAGDAIDVTGVYVENDQEVGKGDIIATLNPIDAQKAIRDAKLSVWNAEIKMRQTKKVYEDLTEDDRIQRQMVEISLIEAKNKLEDAQEKLEDYTIRAPFDGIVTGLSVSAGDSISRDDVIATIVSGKMYADISLNEVDAVNVQSGDKATLSFDAIKDASIAGIVSKIDTIGEVSSNVVSYNAEITFDSQSLEYLKPGMSVDVEIVTEEKEDVIVVPITAVQTLPSGEMVVLIASNEALNDATFSRSFQPIAVKVGISNDTEIEIVSGLSEGDSISLGGLLGSVNETSSDSEENQKNNRSSNGMIPSGSFSGGGFRDGGPRM